jgi:hypothetical protein
MESKQIHYCVKWNSEDGLIVPWTYFTYTVYMYSQMRHGRYVANQCLIDTIDCEYYPLINLRNSVYHSLGQHNPVQVYTCVYTYTRAGPGDMACNRASVSWNLRIWKLNSTWARDSRYSTVVFTEMQVAVRRDTQHGLATWLWKLHLKLLWFRDHEIELFKHFVFGYKW